MDGRHLTDEQLQDYLDGNLRKKNSTVNRHLKSCKICKEQLARYSSLYAVFKTEEKFMLSAQFSENILARVVKQTAPAFAFKGWPLILAVLGSLIGLAAGVYLTGITGTLNLLNNIVEFTKIFLPPLTGIFAYLKEMNLNLGLFGLAALALIFMLFIDHYIFQRQKTISILK